MKDNEYYNKVFKESEEYAKPYKDFIYFDIYKIALNYLNREDKILELGCGTGQFSDLLEDNLYKNYIGIDFSEEAIRQANKKTLFEYKLDDILISELDYNYDTVIAFEVLEHIDYKIVLKKLISGSKIIFSVPNFLCDSHIYKWDNESEIIKSFNEYINIESIEIAMTNKKGSKWFLIKGIIR